MLDKGVLITFSGTDGSGKSTQISILKKKLESEGYNCLIYWARGGYTKNFENLKKTIRLIFRRKNLKPGKSEFRKRILENSFFAGIWLNLAILDLCILWIVILRIKLWSGNIIICDRFYDDTKLDFKINFPFFDLDKIFLWRILSLLRCRPKVSFLLYVSPEVTMKRSKLKNEPFPDDFETLELRLDNYLNSQEFKDEEYIKIESNKSIGAVSQIIKKSLKDFV